MKNFLFGFLSVFVLSALLVVFPSCNYLEGSTQSNTTNNSVSTGDFDIL